MTILQSEKGIRLLSQSVPDGIDLVDLPVQTWPLF